VKNLSLILIHAISINLKKSSTLKI